MGFHIGPRVLSGTGGSIDHKNGYRIHHFPPKITERGLVFNLDFGDKRCEPGYNNGSTDVFGDLSGNGKSFTRSGGKPWTSYAGGVRHFDGTDDYVSFSGMDGVYPSFSFVNVSSPHKVKLYRPEAISTRPTHCKLPSPFKS